MAMNEQLRLAAIDYLRLRRLRGYQIGDQGWLIKDFLDFLDHQGFCAITVDNASAWACLPANSRPSWHTTRLAIVRQFAAQVHARDPQLSQIIPPGLLPSRLGRSTPYLYGRAEITMLIGEARNVRPNLQGETLATIIGLMAATGLRTAEALALNKSNVDAKQSTILVRGKGSKQRLLPIHPSTVTALDRYLLESRALVPERGDAFFMNPAGTRPVANTVQQAFRRITRTCNLLPGPSGRMPRLHDLRHTFAVNTLIDAHRSGSGIDARVAALATYLGHGSPVHTYWYLSASPELLQLVSARIEKHFQGDRP